MQGDFNQSLLGFIGVTKWGVRLLCKAVHSCILPLVMEQHCDLSEQFALHFGEFSSPKLFKDYLEFEDSLKAFQQLTGANYRIRTTDYADQRIKRRVYICVKKGQPLQPSRGMRQKPSAQTGCQSIFSVNQFGQFYRVTSGYLTHNHYVDPVEGSLEPIRRRLDSLELSTIRPWLLNGTPAFQICKFIRDTFRKHTSTKDIVNLRAKCNAEKKTFSCLVQLSDLLNATGRSCCLFDDNRQLTHFIFMTQHQITIAQRYPEVLGMDSTYKTCQPRMSLFIMVAIDSNGIGLPVCFAWLSRETTTAVTLLLRQFKLFSGPIPIRTIITDDHMPSQQAIAQELPDCITCFVGCISFGMLIAGYVHVQFFVHFYLAPTPKCVQIFLHCNENP